MKILDSVRNAVGAAAEAARRTAEAAKNSGSQAEKPAADTQRRMDELTGRTSSFESLPKMARASIDMGELEKGRDNSAIGEELARKAIGTPNDVNDAVRQLGYFSRDDVSLGLSSKLSDEQLKQLAGTSEGKQLLERMKTEMGEGWTSSEEQAQIARIDSALSTAPTASVGDAKKADPNSNLPSELQPGNAMTEHDPVKVDGRNVRFYKTGENVTKVPDDALDIPPEKQAEIRGKQEAFVAEMKSKLPAGTKVDNPPTLEQAQKYFQAIAGKGTAADVENVRKKYGEFLTDFYVHAGQGVDWGAGKNLANNLEKSFADQPRLKDGRQVIDCEGFAALTERVLGPIQDPATKKPMFELMQSATDNHAITGVFRRGDPFNKPFMVSNDSVTPIPDHAMENAKKLARPGQTESAEKFMLKELVYDEVNGGHEKRLEQSKQGKEERPAIEAGRRFDDRKKFF
ncbi:hypothetical protein JRI60_50180 [Archangium violaceum]|uniref:hypothetical protein n=1 Tax=Archangium violaceum TaxID=83451 RepID=UPI00194EC636|nr:hypothetical protein [Archangium violaceum]QRN97043.1 hypothetical protein JRI60_50180 [Archangium violaceum]